MSKAVIQPPPEVPPAFLLHDEEDDAWEVLEGRALSELSEDQDTRRKGLVALRSQLAGEAGLRWQDDDLFLLAFLRARKFHVERALHLIKGFYATLGKHSYIFYDLTQEEVRKTLEQNCMHFLPRKDREGCTVTIFKMSSWNPQVVTPDDLIGAGIVGLLHALCNQSMQVAGIRIVLDYGGFSFNQFLHVSTKHLWLFGEIMQNSLPLRMRGLHIINENRLFHYVWVVLQRFLSRKLKERVHFHGKDFESLHKLIDPNILPAEYGGEQPAFDNFEWRRKIEASSDYINYALSFGYEKYLKSRRKTFVEKEDGNITLQQKTLSC